MPSQTKQATGLDDSRSSAEWISTAITATTTVFGLLGPLSSALLGIFATWGLSKILFVLADYVALIENPKAVTPAMWDNISYIASALGASEMLPSNVAAVVAKNYLCIGSFSQIVMGKFDPTVFPVWRAAESFFASVVSVGGHGWMDKVFWLGAFITKPLLFIGSALAWFSDYHLQVKTFFLPATMYATLIYFIFF